MRPLVLVGSLSQARLTDYQMVLESYGMNVKTLSKDEDYFHELVCHPWGSLLLECSMVWGDSEIDFSSSPIAEDGRDVPLVLFVCTGPNALARPARIPLHGLFYQFPSRDELMSAISTAWSSVDPFVVEESNLEQETSHC